MAKFFDLQLSSIIMLFCIDNVEQDLPEEVSEHAVKAAVNFIHVACQQTAYIAGREALTEEMEKFKKGRSYQNVCFKNFIF